MPMPMKGDLREMARRGYERQLAGQRDATARPTHEHEPKIHDITTLSGRGLANQNKRTISRVAGAGCRSRWIDLHGTSAMIYRRPPH
jgi:hypothetical protein